MHSDPGEEIHGPRIRETEDVEIWQAVWNPFVLPARVPPGRIPYERYLKQARNKCTLEGQRGLVVKVLDSQSKGRGFDSCPWHVCLQPWASCFISIAPSFE